MPSSAATITVTVKLPKLFAKHRPEPADAAPFAVELPVEGTAGDLVDLLGIPTHAAKLIFVDHKKLGREDVLPDGAFVEIFPPVAGG